MKNLKCVNRAGLRHAERQREMLVGTIRCQHWCSDCCGLAEYEQIWQGKCASYLSEKRCLCSKFSAWSHSNFVRLSTLSLSSRRILSPGAWYRQRASAISFVSPFQRSAPFCRPLHGTGCSVVVQTVRQLGLGCSTRQLPRPAVTKTRKLVSCYSRNSLAGWLLAPSLGTQRSPAAASSLRARCYTCCSW